MYEINKYTKNAMVVLEETEGDPRYQIIGYQAFMGHLVIDIKLGEGFRRKALYCADENKTYPPASVTYSTVVSR